MTPSLSPALVSLNCGDLVVCMMARVICVAMRMMSARSVLRPSTPMRSSIDMGVRILMRFCVCSCVKVSFEVFCRSCCERCRVDLMFPPVASVLSGGVFCVSCLIVSR